MSLPSSEPNATEAATPTDGPAAALEADNDRLRRRLDRARQENKILEQMIEDKTRSLYLTQEHLRRSRDELHGVLESMQSAVVVTDLDGRITTIGGRTADLTGWSVHELNGRPVTSVLTWSEADDAFDTGDSAAEIDGNPHPIEVPVEGELAVSDGGSLPVLVTAAVRHDADGSDIGMVVVATDVSERRQLEVELRHAQRLEAIGQLAAGVAHEINTPIQFVGDSVRFLEDVLEDLFRLHEMQRPLRSTVGDEERVGLVRAIEELEDVLDVEFVTEQAPKALARTLSGVDRVATIVRSLKQFAHPGGDDLGPTDVNGIIENTAVVATSEYKYVADLDLDLGDVPEVYGNGGDISQVIINLIVNASHAIEDRINTGATSRGRIVVTTRPADGGVLLTVADDGGGIPSGVQKRIFEPFFTTKAVGRGTGQGLSLAHRVITGKHGGTIEFTVDDGVGTTFRIWLRSAS
ncbi:MAG: ATP-binding protein [Actinomycetota bacterium]